MHVEQGFLINKLKSGDEEAYELLFKEYYTRLVIYADKILNDVEVAREIIQDLFVHIFEKRENIKISSSLSSYLFRAAHNRCINYAKSQQVRLKHAQEILKNNDYASGSVDEILEEAELEADLLKSIEELPEKCRLIFTMNRFKGFTNSEIADELKLSKRTVETQISKALKLLRDRLKNFYSEGVYTTLVIGLIANVVGWH